MGCGSWFVTQLRLEMERMSTEIGETEPADTLEWREKGKSKIKTETWLLGVSIWEDGMPTYRDREHQAQSNFGAQEMKIKTYHLNALNQLRVYIN